MLLTTSSASTRTTQRRSSLAPEASRTAPLAWPARDVNVAGLAGALPKVPTKPALLGLAGALAWLSIASWKLTSVPGMSMDEGWYIVSALGQWKPVNPLSGMTEYTGAFPVLLLEVFGPSGGLWVLRGASLVANGVMLVAIGRMMRRHFTSTALFCWGMALVATCPAWVVMMRTGIEVLMFTPALTVLGLYAFSRPGGRRHFLGGVSWGLGIYNHVLGAFGVAAIIVSWIVVLRRKPRVPLLPVLAGFSLGVLPRVASLTLYANEQINGIVSSQTPSLIFTDLGYLPGVVWDLLHGRTVYLRYVGHLAHEVWPYWGIAGLLLTPWLGSWKSLRRIPTGVWFCLSVSVLCCVFTTLGAPYLAARYLVLPAVGFSVFVASFAASTRKVHSNWQVLASGALAVLVVANSYYLIQNFYLPWTRQELRASAHRLGVRSPNIGSWHFLPKRELSRYLRDLEPRPAQVIADHALHRPLWAQLGDALNVVHFAKADKRMESVLVEHRRSKLFPRRCVPLQNGRKCFGNPTTVGRHFVVYR